MLGTGRAGLRTTILCNRCSDLLGVMLFLEDGQDVQDRHAVCSVARVQAQRSSWKMSSGTQCRLCSMYR